MPDEQQQNQDAVPPQKQEQGTQGKPKQESAKDPKKDATPRQVFESREDLRRKK